METYRIIYKPSNKKKATTLTILANNRAEAALQGAQLIWAKERVFYHGEAKSSPLARIQANSSDGYDAQIVMPITNGRYDTVFRFIIY